MTKQEILKKLQDLYDTNPFVKLLRIEIKDAGAGWAKSQMLVRKDIQNMDGMLHGGAMITLADNLCGVMGRTLGYLVVTQNISASIIRNIPVGKIAFAEGKVLHRGHHVMMMVVKVFNENHELLCDTSTTMFVIKKDERFENLWENMEE